MIESIKQTLEQVISESRERWPAADWVCIEGPQIDWSDRKGLELEFSWRLYVSDKRGSSFDLWAESPAELLQKLQELKSTPALARHEVAGVLNYG